MEPGWQQHLLLVHHPTQPIEMGHDQCGPGRPSLFLQWWCQMKKSLLLGLKKNHHWCLEGIKEWENRIQSTSWSPRHITSSGHCFQMPCIFPCAATSPIPSLAEFRVSAFLHNTVFGKVTKRWCGSPWKDLKLIHRLGVNLKFLG